MAFSKITPRPVAPPTPDALFRELTRRKFPDVLPHQKSMMQRYALEAESKKDVALQLPTGSGKTLVGLLIAEWRRRKNQEKIVYLCPTKQLVHQVVTQAEQKYGLSVVGFTGSQHSYIPSDMAKYNQAECVAVTTYSSLFNTNPYFSDSDVIIIDDAHAAENYVAKLWTMSINRRDSAVLHGVLSSIFKEYIDPVCYTRLTGQWSNPSDGSWVDKIPSPVLIEVHDEICEVLDTYCAGTDLRYSWSMLRNHLRACHIYLSSSDIVIRPLIAPTWDHHAFHNPKQRIYMSATLGEGGDLERLLGRKKIHRLPVPEGLDGQGVGRRFFIFPTLSLGIQEATKLRRSLLAKASRSLVLVPSDAMKNEIVADVVENVEVKVFSANDIEISKEEFVHSTNSVAVVANRYDGIDFPGDECRLLFIEGLPKAVNAQERFLMTRMGANVLFNERIQTRVLQAVGRCTRSLEDYSAVVVTGDELPDYLADPRRREFFHPELQAELWFGVEQSKEKSQTDFEENFDLFIENGADWEAVNQMIVERRKASTQKPFPSIEQLANVVKHEVEYQMAMWQEDYTEALSKAESILGKLTDDGLGGYRALWEYLAGSAAIMAASDGKSTFNVKAREHFSRAKKATKGLPWLVQLSQLNEEHAPASEQDKVDSLIMLQVEKIEGVLSSLGTIHDRKYTERERLILDGLNGEDEFEGAHELLGEHLGFDAGKEETNASPDPWWQAGHICLVFEDHANASEGSSLDAKKARQAASHPKWMRDHVESCRSLSVDITPVLITPVSTVYPGTLTQLEGVALWRLNDFKEWSYNSMAVIRELRKSFVEHGDLVWRAQAAETLQNNGMDMLSLSSRLKTQGAKDLLKEK